MPFRNFFNEVGRAKFLFTGVLLALLKYNLDRIAAYRHGMTWDFFSYWHTDPTYGTLKQIQAAPAWAVEFGLIALPFIVVGVFLTARRLQNAGLSAGWLLLFFIPVVNVFFFAVLSLI